MHNTHLKSKVRVVQYRYFLIGPRNMTIKSWHDLKESSAKTFALFLLLAAWFLILIRATAAAKSLQSCPTLCNPRDGSPPGSSIPGIPQARILEWVAIFFSNASKWKVKVKSLSCVRLFATHGLQPTRLLCPWDFPGKSTAVGCHCLLQHSLWRLWRNAVHQENRKSFPAL